MHGRFVRIRREKQPLLSLSFPTNWVELLHYYPITLFKLWTLLEGLDRGKCRCRRRSTSTPHTHSRNLVFKLLCLFDYFPLLFFLLPVWLSLFFVVTRSILPIVQCRLCFIFLLAIQAYPFYLGPCPTKTSSLVFTPSFLPLFFSFFPFPYYHH